MLGGLLMYADCRQLFGVAHNRGRSVSCVSSLSRLVQTMVTIIDVIRVHRIQLPLDKDILKRNNFFSYKTVLRIVQHCINVVPHMI